MSDTFDALRLPDEPIEPAPGFAARLRRDLQDALLGPTPATTPEETTMSATDATAAGTATAAEPPWPPTITPYIVVGDARRAVDWYVDVFGGHRRGEMYVNDDGTIGHAEVGIGDAVVMIAEPSDLWPDVPVAAPEPSPARFSHTLHVQVGDVDATFARAVTAGATAEREPEDQPYGRVAVVVDPFGHRWYLNRPPESATRVRHGDIGYVTMHAVDEERAKVFFGAVLGWEFSPGGVPRGWQVEDRTPLIGLHGDPSRSSGGAELCFRVDDMAGAIERVRAAGGEAEAPDRRPYGLMAYCRDDQGTTFQLWQP